MNSLGAVCLRLTHAEILMKQGLFLTKVLFTCGKKQCFHVILKKNAGHKIKILSKARCVCFPVWSSLSGPFMSIGLHGQGGSGG